MTITRPVTARELALHFGVTVETVNRWVREHRVPFIRPSRRVVRFRIADVERALSAASAERMAGRLAAEKECHSRGRMGMTGGEHV